jgi:hypothetical protein
LQTATWQWRLRYIDICGEILELKETVNGTTESLSWGHESREGGRNWRPIGWTSYHYEC